MKCLRSPRVMSREVIAPCDQRFFGGRPRERSVALSPSNRKHSIPTIDLDRSVHATPLPDRGQLLIHFAQIKFF